MRLLNKGSNNVCPPPEGAGGGFMITREDLINRELIKECTFKTARSGGKGGQNVNKVETKVELWFNISESQKLTEGEKAVLLKKLNNKLDKENVLHLQEQSDRTQLKNKELLISKFYNLVLQSLKVSKPRKATKVSKTIKAKRSENKKIKSELKQLRRKIK